MQRSRRAQAERVSDPLWQLAETLRGKGGVESRSAVLHGERVEFFRGKDIVRFLKATPEAWTKFASLGAPPCAARHARPPARPGAGPKALHPLPPLTPHPTYPPPCTRPARRHGH
jgi:hypothetical protein